MVKITEKQTARETLYEKISPVYEHNSFRAEHPEGRGDLGELIGYWRKGMERLGTNKAQIDHHQEGLPQKYLSGDRGIFFKPGEVMYERDLGAVMDYARNNIDAIIDSTDKDTLRDVVLPNLVGRYKTNNPDKYESLDKLLKNSAKLGETVSRINSKETQKEALSELVEKRKANYREKYDDPELLEILDELVSEVDEARDVERQYEEMQKKLDEELGEGGVRDYLKSLDVSGEDLASLYINIFAREKQKAKEKQEAAEFQRLRDAA